MAGPVKSRLPATTPLHPPAVLLIILAHLPDAPLHSPAVLLIMAENQPKVNEHFCPRQDKHNLEENKHLKVKKILKSEKYFKLLMIFKNL